MPLKPNKKTGRIPYAKREREKSRNARKALVQKGDEKKGKKTPPTHILRRGKEKTRNIP